MKVYENILEVIGNTPLLKLNRIKEVFKLECNIYAKLEGFNPGGSIKDRIAYAMIKDLENNGILNQDSVLIEPTSGNTGIGLAYIAKYLGYPLVIVMPDNMSKERVLLLKSYGAEVVLTDGKQGMNGAVNYVNECCAKNSNYVLVGQFFNESNPLIHYKTTGPEIMDNLDGMIDVLVAGIGTGGTISGTGKYLKEQLPNCLVIGVEPTESPLITKGESGTHSIQGIGANFLPPNLDLSIIDRVDTVSSLDALDWMDKLVMYEGFFAGISSGAALCAAVQEGQKPSSKNKNIVVILPDRGERYLSLKTNL